MAGMRRSPRSGTWIGALLLALPSWSWGAGEPGAVPVPADAVSEARSVQDALNGLRGLVASFTQTVESAGLPRPQIERGTLYLMRPGRMRWEYDVPRGKLAIADGRQSWVYLPEERQVLVAPLDVEGARNGIALLHQRVDLVGSFEISWGGGDDHGARPILLKPRAPQPEYDHLLLFPGPEHLVKALIVFEPLGSRVSYRFDRLRRVETLDEDLFHFVPPAGIEIQQVPAP